MHLEEGWANVNAIVVHNLTQANQLFRSNCPAHLETIIMHLLF